MQWRYLPSAAQAAWQLCHISIKCSVMKNIAAWRIAWQLKKQSLANARCRLL